MKTEGLSVPYNQAIAYYFVNTAYRTKVGKEWQRQGNELLAHSKSGKEGHEDLCKNSADVQYDHSNPAVLLETLQKCTCSK